jgi:hypothetical protein
LSNGVGKETRGRANIEESKEWSVIIKQEKYLFSRIIMLK